VGIYMATINQHSKELDNNVSAIALVDSKTKAAVELVDCKTQLLDKNLNRRMTEIAEAGVARDNSNEKNVVAIEGKLGRIEDKLDALVSDVRDIKKIVLKPIVGANVKTNTADMVESLIARK
jgi:hypothetical protein